MYKQQLFLLPEETLLEMWNAYMRYREKPYRPYYMNDKNTLNFVLEGLTPYEVLKKIGYGDYRYFDKYFILNVYKNLVSYEDLDAFINYDELVKWINYNPEIVHKEWNL